MKKRIKLLLCILVVCFAVSCKSKAVIAGETATANEDLSTSRIIENVDRNKLNFSTLYIKSNVRYESEKQSQNVTAEIKIKKDEMILVSLRFLGITMAKALITPTKVQYYEKMGSSYFEGDYSVLSKWLGTDLDYQKVQNMLLGQALDNLKKGKYKNSIENNTYKLEEYLDGNTSKSVYITADKYEITVQEIIQKMQERSVNISYSDYKQFYQVNLPSNLRINAVDKGNKTNININYNSVTVNEDLSFPYSVPSGYDQISIK